MLRVRREIPTTRGEFISLGAVGWVHKINDHIALKSPREEDCDKFAHEKNSMIYLNHTLLVQTSLKVSYGLREATSLLSMAVVLLTNICANIKFGTKDLMEVVSLRSRKESPLHSSSDGSWNYRMRLRGSNLSDMPTQISDHLIYFLTVKSISNSRISYSVRKLGTPAEGSAAPWARVLSTEAGDECGSFGDNGARYEQFAIGSVLYMLTRGYEPYDDGSIAPEDAPVVVDLFQQMKFPPLGEDKLDGVIQQCWKGEYETLKDLADETKLLSGASSFPRATAFDDDYCNKVRRECEDLVEPGIFDEN
ncbi:hypothetical protein WAI453_010023 [Rhynchosporium graminicola]